jgi:hypothetical protein
MSAKNPISTFHLYMEFANACNIQSVFVFIECYANWSEVMSFVLRDTKSVKLPWALSCHQVCGTTISIFY